VKHFTEDADSAGDEIIGQLAVEAVLCSGAGREETVSYGLGVKVGEIVLREAPYKEFLERLKEPRYETVRRLFVALETGCAWPAQLPAPWQSMFWAGRKRKTSP